MRYALIGLLFVGMCGTACADEPVWKSPTPSGHILQGFAGAPSSDCYATVRLVDGKRYFHPTECDEKAHNYLDIGIPLDGNIIKMPREARHISVRKKDGWIELR